MRRDVRLDGAGEGGGEESGAHSPSTERTSAPRRRLRKIVVFATATITVLGAVVTGKDFLEIVAGPFTDKEPKLRGYVNIVVADFAIDAPQRRDRDERTAQGLTDALYAVVEDEVAKNGRVEVGRPKDRGVRVYRTAQGRAERLRKDLNSRNGHLAISATLVPGEVDRLRVEVYLDQAQLDEAYELGGYQRLSDAEFGDIAANPAAKKAAQEYLVKKARVYTDLLVAVGEYSQGGKEHYEQSAKDLRALLQRLTEPAEQRFAWLLIGNAEARAGDRSAAKAAYRSALGIDAGYERARLGLAEIEYHEAARNCKRATSDLTELRDVERDYRNLLKASLAAGEDPADLRPRINFALSRTLLCRLLIRGRGDINEVEAGFQAAAGAYTADRTRKWLRTLASDSYGMLGSTSLLKLTGHSPDPVKARHYYDLAAKTAVDPRRRDLYRRQRDGLPSAGLRPPN